MKLGPKIILYAAAAALSFGIAQAEDMTKLKIGTEGAYPPFNNLTADGKLEGFDIDIANALCDEMKVECEFVTQDWDGIIPALQAGKFDAIIASMSITDRAQGEGGLHAEILSDAAGHRRGEGFNNPDASPGDPWPARSLGAQASTTHFNYAEANYGESISRAIPSAQEYQLDLANGRLDAVMDDIIVLRGWLETPDGACCKMLGTHHAGSGN